MAGLEKQIDFVVTEWLARAKDAQANSLQAEEKIRALEEDWAVVLAAWEGRIDVFQRGTYHGVGVDVGGPPSDPHVPSDPTASGSLPLPTEVQWLGHHVWLGSGTGVSVPAVLPFDLASLPNGRQPGVVVVGTLLP